MKSEAVLTTHCVLNIRAMFNRQQGNPHLSVLDDSTIPLLSDNYIGVATLRLPVTAGLTWFKSF